MSSNYSGTLTIYHPEPVKGSPPFHIQRRDASTALSMTNSTDYQRI